MGLLSGVEPQVLYGLEQRIRPAMLTGAPQERDQKRAALLRETCLLYTSTARPRSWTAACLSDPTPYTADRLY